MKLDLILKKLEIRVNLLHFVLNDSSYASGDTFCEETVQLYPDSALNKKLSPNQSLAGAVICSGLFPGIASVVHRETSMSFKTMDDGQVSLYANSVNSRFPTIPYPWLVFHIKQI
ncbi:hypothetical protein Bca4012_083478 [Brassica carinata]